MQDQHTGKAGTFIIDPVLGIRVPIEQVEQATNVVTPTPATVKTIKSTVNEVA